MRDWNNNVRHLIGERSYGKWFGLAQVGQQQEQANERLEQQCTTFNWTTRLQVTMTMQMSGCGVVQNVWWV